MWIRLSAWLLPKSSGFIPVVARFAMATYRHWSVSLWRNPDDVSHCRILSPDKTEWRLISATLCGWRCCFVADQLWSMTRIWEEEDSLVGVSHFSEFHEKRPVTAWEMQINLLKCCILQCWGKWKTDPVPVFWIVSSPNINRFFLLVMPHIMPGFNLLLLVCVSLTRTGQPRNSVFIHRV